MDPCTVVNAVVEKLALNGSIKTSLNDFLSLARDVSKCEPSTDDYSLDCALWTWCIRDPRIIVFTQNRELSPDECANPLDVIKKVSDVYVQADNQTQWRVLTGFDSEQNSLGASAFEVLSVVTRAGPAGLSVIEIAKQTGQDSRSLYGRVQKLLDARLVRRFQVAYKGQRTNQVVSLRFTQNEAAVVEGQVNTAQLARDIVEFAKSGGPKRVRLQREVFKALKFDKMARGSACMRRILTRLESAGAIRRLYLFDPENVEEKFRCIQYLADLDDNLESDDEEIEDEEEDELEIKLEAPLENSSGLVFVEPTASFKPLMNLTLPLEHQIYDLARLQGGTKGISAMDLNAKLAGPAYTRPISRLLDTLAERETPKTQGKQVTKPYSHMDLVAALDSSSRLNFYRYFTRPQRTVNLGKEIPEIWGGWPADKKRKRFASLRELHLAAATPLQGVASVSKCGDQLKPSFSRAAASGNNIVCSVGPVGSGPARLGRPPKKKAAVAKKQSLSDILQSPPEFQGTDLTIDSMQWHGGHLLGDNWQKKSQSLVVAEQVPAEKEDVHGQSPFVLPNASLAMQRRAATLMQILHENNGVVEGGTNLARKIDQLSNTKEVSIDRRTLARTIKELMAVSEVRQMFVSIPTSVGTPLVRQIVHLASIEPSDERIAKVRDAVVASTKERAITRSAEADPEHAASRSVISEVLRAAGAVGVGRGRLRALDSRIGVVPINKNRSSSKERTARGRPALSESQRQEQAAAREALKAEAKARRAALKASIAASNDDQGSGKNGGPIDAAQLFAAVSIFRAVFGQETMINWVTIGAAMDPEESPNRVRRRWPSVRQAQGGAQAVKDSSMAFQRCFLKALNNKVVEWTSINNPNFSLKPLVKFWLDLPASELNAKPTIDLSMVAKTLTATKPHPQSLDHAFTQNTMVRTDEIMTRAQFVFSTPLVSDFDSLQNQLRSVSAANIELYDPTLATELLTQFDNDQINAAAQQLTNLKVLRKTERRPDHKPSGRAYCLHDRVNAALMAPKPDVGLASLASTALSGLNSDGRVPQTVADAQMMALLNAHEAENAALTGIDIDKGRIAKGYRSRFISKDLFDFDVKVEFTPYKPKIEQVKPQFASPIDPFIWQIGKKLSSPEMWKTATDRVCSLVAQKPGSTAQSLASSLQPALSLREITSIVHELQSAKAMTIGAGGELRMEPYWFCALETET